MATRSRRYYGTAGCHSIIATSGSGKSYTGLCNGTTWIRSFGRSNALEKTGLVAHSLDLMAAVGAWLIKDMSANNREVAGLIREARAGHDIAIVGSEVLLRHNLIEPQLLGYMNQVRKQIPAGIPVITADVYGELLEHQAAKNNSDVVLVNYYPYWEGVSIDVAVATLHRWHQEVVVVSGGKSVIVSETGPPSDGNALGNAVSSPANTSYYFLNFVSWARDNNVKYFYFEALDESWKIGEGPQGIHWELWDKSGVLKPGMQAVFDGQTVPDNWTNAGTPSIEFTYVPAYGSFNDPVGQVLHVNTDDYKVAVYIYVGGWWTKPTFATPLTNLVLDGTRTCDITTGGSDQNATQTTAYLMPKDFSPPAMSGGLTVTNAPTTDVSRVLSITPGMTGSYKMWPVILTTSFGGEFIPATSPGSRHVLLHVDTLFRASQISPPWGSVCYPQGSHRISLLNSNRSMVLGQDMTRSISQGKQSPFQSTVLVSSRSGGEAAAFRWLALWASHATVPGGLTDPGYGYQLLINQLPNRNGTQVFFCVSGTGTCYQHPSAGMTVNNPSVNNVNLSSGSWQMYVRTSAGLSARAAAFTVQAAAPTISAYFWDSTPTGNRSFGGTISGTSFIPGGRSDGHRRCRAIRAQENDVDVVDRTYTVVEGSDGKATPTITLGMVRHIREIVLATTRYEPRP